MAEQYAVLPAPVKTHEVVEAVALLLSGGSGKPANLSVYEHRQPDNHADRFIVVREPQVLGGRRESQSRVDVVQVQVMVEIRSGVEPDPDKYLADAHAWAFTKIVGQAVSFTSGSAALKAERSMKPGPAAYDADTDTLYSTAEYLVVVKP